MLEIRKFRICKSISVHFLIACYRDLSIATQLGDFLADKEDEVKANSRNLASYAKDEVETNSSDHATSEADENKTNPPNNMFLVEEVAIGPPNQMASSEENQVDSFSPNNSPLQK